MVRKNIILILILSFFTVAFNWSGYKFYKLNGDTISYDDLFVSSPHLVIMIWTSYCPYCREELEKSNDYNFNPGITFYYANVGDNKRIVKRVAELLHLKDNVKNSILLDKKGVLVDTFHVMGVPAYIFLNNGKVIYKSRFVNDNMLKKLYEQNEQNSRH